MNAERLLQHFERISEAPDAIPRLRRFIMDLAVRGKLVPQDPNDEPAAELLKRIQAEKALNDNKSKELTSVTEDEMPFGVPAGWKWVRIRQISTTRGQTVPKGDFTYIDVTAIDKEHGCIGNPTVLSASEAPSRARKVVQKGDVIYSCVRPYLLNIAIIDTDITPQPIVSTAFAVLNGFGLTLPQYLWTALRSPFMVESVEIRMRGQAYPAINDSDFALLPIPLPPLAEQHRIVAKVDELMALCEELEAAKQRREQSRDRLVAATLHNLNNGSASPEPGRPTFEESARFYFKHLPRLTTRLEHIKQLRQTILNLAVRGKLVEQDPNDEPAEELLKRIQAEKALNDNKAKELTLVTEDEMPFGVPGGWKWVRIRQISTAHGQTIPKADFTYIDVTAIDKERGCIGNPTVLSASEAPSRARKVVQKGDVIYSCVRPYLLNIAIIDTDITPQPIASTAFAVLNGFDLTLPQYLWTALRSPFMVESVESRMRGQAYPAINDSDFALLPIPLPPLAEQHRIVAKVDELMAVCNELEIRLATTSATHKKLLEATLQEALNGYSELLKVRCKWLKTK
ncbi:MAG: restriction endonuclease subunit S [Leptospirales bacterium]